MLRRIVVGVFAWVFLSAAAAWATAPEALDLAYDLPGQVLKVHVEHTAHNLRRQYIRQFHILINGKFVKDVFYRTQPTRYEFTQEVPLAAKPGDIISLTAYGSEGGSREAEVTVKKKAPEGQPASP